MILNFGLERSMLIQNRQSNIQKSERVLQNAETLKRQHDAHDEDKRND